MGEKDMPADGRFASTRQNRLAGRALRVARLASGAGSSTQAAFAARLARALGFEISAAALSNWENGRRSVPTALVIEAGAISGISVDALLAQASGGLAPQTDALEGTERIATLERMVQKTIGERLDSETKLEQLVAELREEVGDQAKALALVYQRLQLDPRQLHDRGRGVRSSRR